MSILSSLFGNKKKGKRHTSPSRPTTSGPPATSSKVRAPSPNRQASSSPSRFLSLRRKSSVGSPLDAVSRRDSGEANRKRRASPPKDGLEAKQKEWELPSLGFVDAGGAGKAATGSGLGLDDVGGLPTLSSAEQAELAAARFGQDELGKSWKVLGGVLRTTGHPTAILELADAEREQQVIVLSALAYLLGQPSKIRTFPSLAARYPSTTSTDTGRHWSDRLGDVARASSPEDIAAALKWTVRRLKPGSSDSLTPGDPLISAQAYVQFVQAEHAASYPADAYHLLLPTRIPPRVMRLLHEIFDAWAALTAQADDQSGLGGKMALLMGWWIMCPGISAEQSWGELYAAWRLAARRVEHLFLAWIRHQATTHKLPTRLLRLVERYPYGDSDYSAETLPSPPPSSFLRVTLHVHLQTDQPLESTLSRPATILHAALSAKSVETSYPIWQDISRESSGSTKRVQDLVDEASFSFLNRSGGDSSSGKIPAPTPSVDRPESRPAHARRGSNAKALDALAEEVGNMANAHRAPLTPGHQSSPIESNLPRSESTWDDFKTSGFGASGSGGLDLALAPSPVSATSPPLDGQRGHSRLNGLPDVPRPSRQLTFEPQPQYIITSEEIIEMDDMFLPFAEESQLDTSVTSDWPRFVLVRLRHPYSPAESETAAVPIERLLITVSYRPPSPPPPPKTPSEEISQPRSTTPSAESPFRFGSFGFKRTASRPTFRSAFFGSSRSVAKEDSGTDFISGDTGETKRITLHSKASSTSIDELGQTSRRTSGQNSTTANGRGSVSQSPNKEAASSGPDRQDTSNNKGISTAPGSEQTPLQGAKLEPISPTMRSEREHTMVSTVAAESALVPTPPSSIAAPRSSPPVPSQATEPPRAAPASPSTTTSPSYDTAPTEWTYGAEGGAHVVFPYSGSSGPYAGRLLRIRKISNHRDDPLESTSALWRDTLLGRVVPAHLLIQGEKVHLDRSWLGSLLETAEAARLADRRAVGELSQLIGDDPSATVMENLRMSGEASALRKVLAVEIKPKWGFLPDAEHIHPPEAATIKSATGRYTLHQHYRGASGSEQEAYDPLDLFSSDEARLTAALSGLWGIWRETEGKANSFRVFVDGQVVHPDERDINTSLLDITAPILIPLLQKSGCLKALGDLQSSLDPIDISGLAALFHDAYPGAAIFDQQLVPDIRAEEMEAFVSKYLSNPSAGKTRSAWTLRERIVAYSLSAIFKDCSIIIRAVLSPREDGGWNVEDESTVKLLDLDLKPLKMRHWAELDEKIWRHWHETKVLPASAKNETANGTKQELDGGVGLVELAGASGPESTAATALTASKPSRTVPGEFPGVPDIPPTPAATDHTSTGILAHTPAPGPPETQSGSQPDSIETIAEGGVIEQGPTPSDTDSALSTPFVPGAFNFPTPPTHSAAIRSPAPIDEVLVDRTHESISAVDHAGLSADATSSSPTESRFQRSTAPSPSPGPTDTV